MATLVITPGDLAPFATIEQSKAEAMIEDAMAWAVRVAPCLAGDELTDLQAKAAKAVLRQALLRWDSAGAGALTQRQQTIGPASLGESIDTRPIRKGMFWPSEIADLQAICSEVTNAPSGGKAFAVDTMGVGSAHIPWCNVNFGAGYCSCGADLTNYQYPLYEGGELSP